VVDLVFDLLLFGEVVLDVLVDASDCDYVQIARFLVELLLVDFAEDVFPPEGGGLLDPVENDAGHFDQVVAAVMQLPASQFEVDSLETLLPQKVQHVLEEHVVEAGGKLVLFRLQDGPLFVAHFLEPLFNHISAVDAPFV